jgi:hypothetical protein
MINCPKTHDAEIAERLRNEQSRSKASGSCSGVSITITGSASASSPKDFSAGSRKLTPAGFPQPGAVED